MYRSVGDTSVLITGKSTGLSASGVTLADRIGMSDPPYRSWVLGDFFFLKSGRFGLLSDIALCTSAPQSVEYGRLLYSWTCYGDCPSGEAMV